METTPDIITLRTQFYKHNKTWVITKRSNSGDWCFYDGKEYASFEECERNVDLLCDTYPTKYSKAVICAERYKQAAKAEEDLTAAFEALVKNHNEIAELERTIK